MDPSVNQAPDIGPVRPEAAPPQQQTPEKPNEQAGAVERAPTQPERGVEKANHSEQQIAAAPAAPSPATVPAIPLPPVLPAGIKDDDTPAIAQDVDLIEKEWVNKAKEVIANTKNDPHAQEAAFEKLQSEYLKKRYGYERGMGAAA